MAKKEKKSRVLKMAKETTEKLDPKQLKKIREHYAAMDAAAAQVGKFTLDYELQKANILNDVSHRITRFNDMMKDIQEEYGRININLSDGSFTIIEDEATTTS